MSQANNTENITLNQQILRCRLAILGLTELQIQHLQEAQKLTKAHVNAISFYAKTTSIENALANVTPLTRLQASAVPILISYRVSSLDEIKTTEEEALKQKIKIYKNIINDTIIILKQNLICLISQYAAHAHDGVFGFFISTALFRNNTITSQKISDAENLKEAINRSVNIQDIKIALADSIENNLALENRARFFRGKSRYADCLKECQKKIADLPHLAHLR